MRQHAQLDLRVVRGDQQPVRRACDEGAADPPSERRADRDVLEIRAAAREPSGGGNGLVEGRVDPPCLRVDESAEPFGVCGSELLDLAVLEDLLYHRMRAAKLLEHRGIRREARAGAPAARELQLLEQE